MAQLPLAASSCVRVPPPPPCPRRGPCRGLQRRSAGAPRAAAAYAAVLGASPNPLGFASPGVPYLRRPARRGAAPAAAQEVAELAAGALDFAVPRDPAAAAFGVVGAGVLVKGVEALKKNELMDQTLTRKLTHILSGPLFMLSWALYSDLPGAKWLAAAAPALNLVRLLVVGSGLLQDEDSVASISRSGDKAELLAGPTYYVIVMLVCTVCFWRTSAAGVVALSMMCAGDGLADVVGRRWGKGNKLPFNPDKSWAGSIAMFGAGLGASLGFLALFSSLGYLDARVGDITGAVALICLVSTAVESIPAGKGIDDNISVPAVAILLGLLLL